MTVKGKFEIEGSFNLSNRGIVVFGVISSGTISRDNFIVLNISQQETTLKINGIDFLDNINEKITKIGLTFQYENDEQLESIQNEQFNKQTATILEL
jgi:translation elongation factor EF-Tu-like GTPase